MKKSLTAILIHLAGWLVFFLMSFFLLKILYFKESVSFINFYKQGLTVQLALHFLLFNQVFLIVFFYTNIFLFLPNFYHTQKKAGYFAIVLLFMIITVFFSGYVRNELPADVTNLQHGTGQFGISINSALVFLYFLIIWFVSSLINLAERYRVMEQINKQIQLQKLQNELSYLKAQIPPHFLFNTLNNIYALSICKNEQTPEAILKLSAIMRFITEGTGTDSVPLEKELDYLKNYVALQQLRSDNKLTVSFKIDGDGSKNIIAPLLLINFIENAFKHGISNHTACYVHISIDIADNKLRLTVSNIVMQSKRCESTATGTNNTLRRLQLQYANKHTLTIDNRNNQYKIILQLHLA